MRSVKIGELKAHLSKYLRLVRNGEAIRVLDRDEPIAMIVRSKPTIDEYIARLANLGRVRVGTQDFSVWKQSRPRMAKAISIEDIVADSRAIDGD